MDDRELISKLVTFLLGENWHSCCINSENINLDIYETVCGRYRGVKECNAKGKTVNIDIPKPFCSLFELNIKKEK